MGSIELSNAPKINQIEFISLLGVGGMSRVYKARQTLLDRIVAVKVLSQQAILTETAVKRFYIEAKLTSSLSHPNIVQVMNHGISVDGQAYLVMEFVEGKSLFEIISKDAPISYRRFQNIFIPLLSALEHAHEKGIVHRDIKPSNIIISQDANGNELAKLVDFGIAKTLVEPVGSSTAVMLTKTGFTIGSPAYMSPEQCLGQDVDCRSDLYSLACVMYESLSGEPPYSADTSLNVMYKHMHEPRIKTKELSARMEIPEVLVKAILWPLNKERNNRPESASKLATRLSAALDEITLDRAPHKVQKIESNGKKRPLYIACALAAMVLCVLAVSLGGKEKHSEDSTTVHQRIRKLSLPEQAQEVAMLVSNGKDQEAIALCQRAIEVAKRGPRRELAETYQAAYTGLSALGPGRSRQIRDLAIVYARQALALFEYLKDENGICEVSREIALIFAGDNRGKESLQTLDNAMRRITNSSGNRSWYICNKLACLLSLQRYREAAQIGRLYFAESNVTSRNTNYYLAWYHFTRAVERSRSSAEAVSEQFKLANSLLKERNLTIPQRLEIFQAIDALLFTERPAFAISTIKLELLQNKNAYDSENAEQACWLHMLLGKAYELSGQRDLAQLEFLKVLNRSAKLQPRSLSIVELRRQCLLSLIRISKDEPSTRDDYLEELKKLNQAAK